MEWQEPHLRIIERREGPGDDASVLILMRYRGGSLGAL